MQLKADLQGCKLIPTIRCYFPALLLLLSFTPRHSTAQQKAIYRDSLATIDARIDDLLSRMTPEEKFFQLFMVPGDVESVGKEALKKGIFGFRVASRGETKDAAGQMLRETAGGEAGSMAVMVNETQRFLLKESRLGIPGIQFDEALHGLTREGATRFPQAIGLAATFNDSLVHRAALAIAAETRTRGIRMVLSPVLNIARDVRWGRTEETFGEDPLLVSRMGVAFISAFEKNGIVTTPKHFAVNVGDGGRDSYPIHYNERILEEIYFPAFRAAFREGGARSVMTAYNSLDGSMCSANDWLLNRKLKKEWGFGGFVISDACAVGGANVLHYTAGGYAEAGKQSVENGLDVIFQTDYTHAPLFMPPFLDGSVRQGAIDSAVRRVLKVKFELGLFENPYVDPRLADSLNGAPSHRALALQAARESLVLLKNEGVLPFSKEIRTLLVTGADAAEARPGGYSGPGNHPVSILDGIREAAGEGVKIIYSPGCGREDKKYAVVPAENLWHVEEGALKPGLSALYYANNSFSGEPVITRTDAAIDFGWTLYGPDPALPYDWYSVTWTGKITGPADTVVMIGFEGNDGYRLSIDGKVVIDNMAKRSFGARLVPFRFVKGRKYDFRADYFESTGNARLRLVWDAGCRDTLSGSINRAAAEAKHADAIVAVVGIEEGEFRDRSDLRLPGRQEEFISSLGATGKPVVVVLVAGSAVTMSAWIDNAEGILAAWYPGEAGGTAVGEVLFGKYNPAGRLPVTFPLSTGQLPLVYNHKPTGRGDDYNDLSGMPLFPFGYGLSYTTFSYSGLTFSKDTLVPGETGAVTFTVRNSGPVTGEEVCQLYIRDELASLARPVTELKNFRRIRLEPGEQRRITFPIGPDELSMLNRSQVRVTEPGSFRIMVGASSEDIRLRGKVEVR